jgi:hypothetical protein
MTFYLAINKLVRSEYHAKKYTYENTILRRRSVRYRKFSPD